MECEGNKHKVQNGALHIEHQGNTFSACSPTGYVGGDTDSAER